MPVSIVCRPCVPKEVHERMEKSCQKLERFVNTESCICRKEVQNCDPHAVEASSSWKSLSPVNLGTELCNKFAAEGNVRIRYGFEGAGQPQTETKNPTGQGPVLPILQSNLFKAQGKVKGFFLFQCLLIAESPFFILAASGESPAAVVDAESVGHGSLP